MPQAHKLMGLADGVERWEWRRLSLECTQLRIAAADQRGLPPPPATATSGLDEDLQPWRLVGRVGPVGACGDRLRDRGDLR